MRKSAIITVICIILLMLAGCAGEDGNMTGQKNPIIEITVRDYGKITVQLDSAAAPITVKNFVDLTESGFYDGTEFHRIIKGFMIQGGGPKAGSSEAKQIKGEFDLNGWQNPIKHVRGTISMARLPDPYMDSATSQFFICDEDREFLDGKYAAFGSVINGMDVVDEIAKTPVTDNNGSVSAENRPIIESVRVIGNGE